LGGGGEVFDGLLEVFREGAFAADDPDFELLLFGNWEAGGAGAFFLAMDGRGKDAGLAARDPAPTAFAEWQRVCFPRPMQKLRSVGESSRNSD